MLNKKNPNNMGIRKGVLFLAMKSALFVVGLFVLSLGAATMIQANIGVATWDVLHIGLTNRTSLSVGTWVQIVGVIMVLFTCLLERQLPKVGSLFNIILSAFFSMGF